MKNYISISLFVFWAIIVAVLVAGLVFYDTNKNITPPVNNTATTSSTGSTSINSVNQKPAIPKTTTAGTKSNNPAPITTTDPVQTNNPVILNMPEIAKHNSVSDCWFLIDGNVYDVTSFIKIHPGGSRTIIPYCGKEATQAFDTKGGGGSHSNQARSLLANYLIGQLNQSASAIF